MTASSPNPKPYTVLRPAVRLAFSSHYHALQAMVFCFSCHSDLAKHAGDFLVPREQRQRQLERSREIASRVPGLQRRVFDCVEEVIDVARWYLSGFDGGRLGVRGLGAGVDGFGFV